jgi:hypothetical protein
MAFEPPRADIRASDAEREATAERLRAAAMEGRLDHEELEERLAAAYGARWSSELTRLTADVTVRPGRPSPPAFVRPRARTNALAVASLVLSVFWMGGIGSVAGIILGHTALRQINASGGTQSGRSLAIAGLLLGYLWIGIVVLIIAAFAL